MPHWATPEELLDILRRGVQVEIHAMFERTKGSASKASTAGLQNPNGARMSTSSSSSPVSAHAAVASRPTLAKLIASAATGSGTVGSRGDVRAPELPKKLTVDDSLEVRSVGSESPVKPTAQSRMPRAKPATRSNPGPHDNPTRSRHSGGVSAPTASA